MSPIIVFVGPTLAHAAARELLDANYRPPAAQGDVYRAALAAPWGIGIIDGYFEQQPAVWHKEILWALSQGIHVFGAASMGALRAVELADFGMVGVGRVVDAFASGELTDDDEVAVLHAAAEHGYRAASDAMVDIRATLTAAQAAHVISDGSARALCALAKALHYTERSYPRLVQDARAHGVPADELARLRAWLPEQRVAQKRLDAQQLLQHMARARLEHPDPVQVDFVFETTDAFERMRQRSAKPEAEALGEAVLEELRLDPLRYAALARDALARVLARASAEQQGLQADETALRDAAAEFRRERGLYETAETVHWLEQRGLGRDDLAAWLQDELCVRAVRSQLREDVAAQLQQALRVSGEYEHLSRRARDKARCLEQHGHSDPAIEHTGLSEHELLVLVYGEPRDPDALLRELDYPDPYTCIRALVREYLYRQLTPLTLETT